MNKDKFKTKYRLEKVGQYKDTEAYLYIPVRLAKNNFPGDIKFILTPCVHSNDTFCGAQCPVFIITELNNQKFNVVLKCADLTLTGLDLVETEF